MRYLILTLVFYLVYKYVKYLVHSLSQSTTGSQFGSGASNSGKAKVQVNTNSSEKKFDDGEYIDFEEVD